MAANSVRIPITALDKTGAAFSSVSKGLANVGVRVAKLGVAFGTLGVAAGAAIIRSQMQTIDALGKTADKIGVATEALSAMHHAANLTGVATSTMNMGLQRFTRRVSEAARGTGEAKGALRELNIDAKELMQLPLDKQMGVVADSLNNLDSQFDRVRLAQKLFDSEGVALLQTLKGGSVGLQQMATEAERLGLTLDRADVAMVEAANDEITRAMAVLEGLANQVSVTLAPFIGEVANQFAQAALDSERFGNVGQEVVHGVVNAVAGLVDFVRGIKIALKGVEIAWTTFKAVGLAALAILVSPIQAVINGINSIRAALGMELIPPLVVDNLITTTNELQNLRAEFDALREAPSALETVGPMLERITAGARERAEVIKGEAEAQADSAKNARTLTVSQIAAREELDAFEAKSRSEKAQHVTSHMRELFGKNKAVNIAAAIMDTYAGATKALAAYPPPLSFAFAAATVAAGLAQVANIRAQSFEGGGYTGMGARSGGMDGKGGFMAMLHPNESVIDHTKGQGAGVTVINNVDARGSGADVEQKIRVAMAQTSEQTILTIRDLMRRRRFT